MRKLDLEPVVFTLTELPQLGRQCVDLGTADGWVDRYRLFLVLAGLYSDLRLMPTREIDVVWCVHVLDSGKYSSDCLSLFGAPMHRFPYAGVGDERDTRMVTASFAEMARLFETEFGSALIGEHAAAYSVYGPHAELLERPRPSREPPT